MARRAKKADAKLVEEVSVEEQAVAQESTEVEALSKDEVDDAAQDQDQDTHVYSACGGQLQLARNEQGLSVNEAAKQLRLSVKQIEALEKDDFSVLPESTIVKGFIRNYAKLLKIPSEPLIQAYMQLTPEQEHYAFALNPGINRKISEKSTSSYIGYYAFILLGLLGVAVWFFYQSYIQKPSPVTPMPETAEVLPELALPIAERENPAEIALEMPKQAGDDLPSTQVNQDEQATSTTVDNNSANQADASVAQTVKEANADDEDNPEMAEADAPVEATAAAKQDAVAPGKRRIHFSATQETWLSIVNVNGNEVYNKILYPGHQDTVDVWKPMEIVVGNAHGATLTVDGEKIDLAPYTRINVARVRLNR